MEDRDFSWVELMKIDSGDDFRCIGFDLLSIVILDDLYFLLDFIFFKLFPCILNQPLYYSGGIDIMLSWDF